MTKEALIDQLSRAGFLAADEEAEELIAFAAGDDVLVQEILERRLDGEPLAWITRQTVFCDLLIKITKGVYVPRWQSEALARRALDHLPSSGLALEVCCGAGAIAKVLNTNRPDARVVAVDIDPSAVACATSNGIEAYCSDLLASIPSNFEGSTDVIVGVLPYVPTRALSLLQRDTFRFESTLAYDGGPDGTDLLHRVMREAVDYLRIGGALLLELADEQVGLLSKDLAQLGYVLSDLVLDEEGDVRGIEAIFRG